MDLVLTLSWYLSLFSHHGQGMSLGQGQLRLATRGSPELSSSANGNRQSIAKEVHFGTSLNRDHLSKDQVGATKSIVKEMSNRLSVNANDGSRLPRQVWPWVIDLTYQGKMRRKKQLMTKLVSEQAAMLNVPGMEMAWLASVFCLNKQVCMCTHLISITLFRPSTGARGGD